MISILALSLFMPGVLEMFFFIRLPAFWPELRFSRASSRVMAASSTAQPVCVAAIRAPTAASSSKKSSGSSSG